MITIEYQLARVRILAELPILKELDRQIMRIDLRFNVGSNRRKCVE
jgi:hypothetical protein